MNLPVVLLMGPTASGKSALALALAQRFAVEIVTVDSAQVYQGMDVGTAKPDAAARARVPHHLLDLIPPTQSYSAARFVHDALAAIAATRARNRLPLLVGGTMLYFKALLEGLSRLPGADAELRKTLEERGRREGWPALHAELASIDPATAARLKPTDGQRIQRALEVFKTTGVALSALQGSRQPPAALGTVVPIALLPQERVRLHRIIADRFQAMLAAGLVDEVRRLRERHALRADLPSMRCVGYRQVWEVLEGAASAETLGERGTAATRQLAKRQFTWLRAFPALVFDPWATRTLDAVSAVIAEALAKPGASTR